MSGRLNYTEEQLNNLRVAFGEGRSKRIFTVWRWVVRGSEWTKKPEHPPGALGVPFDHAHRAYLSDRSIAGLGVLLGPIHGTAWVLFGVDYDGAAKGPLPDPWPKVETYLERSPSGGDKFHVLGAYRGEPLEGKRRGAVEIYTAKRYFTLTGDRISGKEIRETDPQPFYAALGVHAPEPYQTATVATFVRAAPLQVWELTARERQLLALVRVIQHDDLSARDFAVCCELRDRGATDEEIARVLCAGFWRDKLRQNKSYLALTLAKVRKEAVCEEEAAERQAIAVNRLLRTKA